MSVIESRADPAPSPFAPPLPRRLIAVLFWLFKLASAIFVFVGALQVMKTGAAEIGLLKSGGPLIANSGSSLALGWLGALMVLSGSPIAASSLTLVSNDALSIREGFWMLTGSRLGAAFVVLFVGVVYAFRGGKGKRGKPVDTGIIALLVTALVYIPGSIIGARLLDSRALGAIEPQLPLVVADSLDLAYGGLIARVEQWPGILAFGCGLALLLTSFKMIDGVIPDLDGGHIQNSRLAWLRSKWMMFGLGALVALVTMSVSVALSVLVPLVARNYVRREEIIPYVMGANITTLGDTLLAALLLDSPDAVRAVSASLIGTTIVSLLLLAFFYGPIRAFVRAVRAGVLRSRTSLGIFTACLFLAPLTILVGSRLL